jgi:hypothetical protein
MIHKHPLLPDRVRTIPAGFGWIDRRLIRDRHFESLDASAILLYYFLVTVADAQGISFWADPTVSRLLEISPGHVVGARDRLRAADLVAYRHPLYQVLSLPERRPSPAPSPTTLPPPTAPPRAPERPRHGKTLSGSGLFLDAVRALRAGQEEPS